MELPLQTLLHNQGNKTFKRISQSAIKFVSETLSSSFKVLYESSKWPASFVEERNAKLLSEMRENHAKCVSVKKQPPEVFYKKSVLISLYSQESYVLESLFWFKRDSNTGVYLWILKKICERLLLIVLRSDYFLSTPFALKSYDFFQRYKNSMNWSSVQLAINFLL